MGWSGAGMGWESRSMGADLKAGVIEVAEYGSMGTSLDSRSMNVGLMLKGTGCLKLWEPYWCCGGSKT